jgi:probable rRNA maturation factor
VRRRLSRSPERGPEFAVFSAVPGVRVRRRFLLECARRASRHIRRRIAFVHFILTGDREMARLHRTYMGLRGTTDVLSFDLSESPHSPVEGEIYIAVNQARRQAALYRVPLYLETARLAVHGVLHLAGFDDDTPAARERMHRLEDRILRQVRPSP